MWIDFFLVSYFVAFARTEVYLWGSRVDGTPSAPFPMMFFRTPSKFEFWLANSSDVQKMDIADGKCKVSDKVVGSPCEISKGYANVTLDNASVYEYLVIVNGTNFEGPIFTTAYFVPRCQFSKPKPGHVDLNASFPLSRFVGSQTSVLIEFAVGGVDYDSEVILMNNSTEICRWQGRSLVSHPSDLCGNLTEDRDANLRRFSINATRNYSQPFDIYYWGNSQSNLVISVDWTTQGESPEISECKKYPTTHSPTTTILSTVPQNYTESTKLTSETTRLNIVSSTSEITSGSARIFLLTGLYFSTLVTTHLYVFN